MAEKEVKDVEKYDENSIQSLDDRTHVRLRPAMYIGDTGVYGLHHLVYEIVDNSIDEITNGYGNLITCIIEKDGFVSVEDNGRGIPVGLVKGTEKSAAETVLTSLRSGGKFNNKNYTTSAGLHGIGAAAVNFLSEQFDIIINREGFTWAQSYRQGIPGPFIKGDLSGKTGTTTRFKPDHKIFQTVEFQYKILYERLKELAYLNHGVHIVLIDENTGEKSDFFSEGGIAAFIEDLNKDKESISPVIFFSQDADVKNEALGEYKVKIETAFQYTKTYSDIVLCFANNINTREGGTHLSGFKGALLDSIEKYIERKKLFKGMNIKLTPRDILEGLTAVISIKLPNPELEGQTKSTLGNPEIKVIVYDQILECLRLYFDKFDSVTMSIAEKIAQACIAREEARKARETVRRKNILSNMSLPGKLSDCQSRNPEICELLVVEGDCFKADTLVHTKEGLKRLDEIKTGDLIYTHMHRYRPALERKPKVKRKKCRIYIQDKVFVCSKDHLWGVMRANDDVCEWVPAKELKVTDLIVKTMLPADNYSKVVDIKSFISRR
jgi:DNA gyrase subunit B